MEEKVIEVESGGGQMTRSIRANKADFDALKEVAERLGMSQGAAFSQLLASWELHHASDTMQEQAGAVKAAQTLLAQLENLFTGQFAAMSALEAEAKKAASAEVETLRRQLVAARDDEQAARADADEAQKAAQAAKEAKKAAQEAEAKAKAEKDEASCKRRIAEDALAAVQSAADDARKERDAAKAESATLNETVATLQEKAAGYDTAVAALDAEKAKVAELREELAAEKADRRKAMKDLTELMKGFDARIDKAKTDAAKAAKAELRSQYDKQYNDALEKLRKKADEEVKRRVAEAKQEFESAQWASDVEKLAEQDKPFEPKGR